LILEAHLRQALRSSSMRHVMSYLTIPTLASVTKVVP